MKFPIKYQNGNVLVRLYEDGTKFRYCKGIPKPAFPESIDLKIINRCHVGCEFCHEDSRPNGRLANLGITLQRISCLPKGVEIAIGGGDLAQHPDLYSFIKDLRELEYVVSVTIRYGKPIGIASSLINGMIGLSGTPIEQVHYLNSDTKVIQHVIAGITEVEDLMNYQKVLVLGFKHFGRAQKMDQSIVHANLDRWRKNIHRYLGTRHIMFDNLAIEQLDLRRFYSDEGWRKLYMGDDGQFSMYVDAVTGKFAINSMAPKKERVSWDDIDLLKFFETLHK